MEKIIINQSIPQKQPGKPRILVTPLDWGLGHATRCIPIIKELLSFGCEVFLAGEGAQEIVLRTEFPQLSFLQLQGYRIRYAKTAWGLIKNILIQTPQILRAIKNEYKWLQRKTDEYGFDAVISDNRYGLRHQKIPCIFITHQLKIKSPIGKGGERILQKRNYGYIDRFTECWVPDEEDKNNLAGELSHPEKKPNIPLKYIGLLSRFNNVETNEEKDHLLIIISGPEPQRSIFENLVIKQIAHYNGTATIVRGLPNSSSLIPSTNTILFYNHLPAEELNKEMQKAEFIIARSGYSTIMDLIRLRKKSILIPTPGQTEQEYLAKHLADNQIIFRIDQKKFSLDSSLNEAKKFSYELPSLYNGNKLRSVIDSFLSSLK